MALRGIGCARQIKPLPMKEVATLPLDEGPFFPWLTMATFCILRGIMDMAGLPHRSSSTAGLQVFSGICGLVLGILLLLEWPSDAEWAPGLLFGVQLFFLGLGTLAVWNALDHPEVSGVSSEEA